jgi:hypothetical protein
MALRLRNGMSTNGALSCPTFYFCTKRTYQRAEHYVLRAVRLEYEDSCHRILCVAGNMPFTSCFTHLSIEKNENKRITTALRWEIRNTVPYDKMLHLTVHSAVTKIDRDGTALRCMYMKITVH